MFREAEDRSISRTENLSVSLLVERLCAFASSGRRLFAAAALLHVTLSAGLFWAGRAQLAPRYLDRDGIVVASDSHGHRDGAVRLAEILKVDGFAMWAAHFNDFLMPVPRQLLFIRKIEPSQWYLDIKGFNGPTGFMFGVNAQAIVGFGWLELVLRGALVGILFAWAQR